MGVYNAQQQERFVDPFQSYDSSIVNQLTSIISESGKLILNGLNIENISDTQLTVTKGMFLKDHVVIKIKEDLVVNKTDTNALTGSNLIIIDYVYEKIQMPNIAEIDIIPEGLYDETRHVILGSISVDNNGNFIRNSFSITNSHDSNLDRHDKTENDWIVSTLTGIINYTNYILTPENGRYNTDAGIYENGYIKIVLPFGLYKAIVGMNVDIVTTTTSNTSKSCSLFIGGRTTYNVNDLYPTWDDSCFSVLLSNNDFYEDLPVQFGFDDNLQLACIYIGESSSNWLEPQVNIKNVIVKSLDSTNIDWHKHWDVSFSPSTSHVTKTVNSSLYSRESTVTNYIYDHNNHNIKYTSDDFVKVIDYEDTDVLSKIKNVDGPGSGLDADLLDGHDSSYFAPTNDPHFTGTIYLNGIEFQGGSGGSGNLSPSDILNAIKTVDGPDSGLNADLLDGHEGDYYAPINDPVFTGTPKVGTYKILTEYDLNNSGGGVGGLTALQILNAIKSVDGSGSGLDADTLDGFNSTDFAPINSPNFIGTPTINGVRIAVVTDDAGSDPSNPGSNADYLDGYDSSYFAPIDSPNFTGTPTVNGFPIVTTENVNQLDSIIVNYPNSTIPMVEISSNITPMGPGIIVYKRNGGYIFYAGDHDGETGIMMDPTRIFFFNHHPNQEYDTFDDLIITVESNSVHAKQQHAPPDADKTSAILSDSNYIITLNALLKIARYDTGNPSIYIGDKGIFAYNSSGNIVFGISYDDVVDSNNGEVLAPGGSAYFKGIVYATKGYFKGNIKIETETAENNVSFNGSTYSAGIVVSPSASLDAGLFTEHCSFGVASVYNSTGVIIGRCSNGIVLGQNSNWDIQSSSDKGIIVTGKVSLGSANNTFKLHAKQSNGSWATFDCYISAN